MASFESRIDRPENLARHLAGLRGPLDGILGRIDLLLEHELPVESRVQADAIQREAQALFGRLRNVRDLLEAQTGRLEVAVIPFDLETMLQSEVGRFVGAAEAAGVELALEIHADVPRRVVGDPSRLRQVIGELVAYALEHTPRGSVEVRATPTGPGRVLFDVEDTGIGFSRERIERILHVDGTRLGLALGRELVELMGSELEVRSRVGVGTRFRFELQLPAAPTESAPLARAELDHARVLVLAEDDDELEDWLQQQGMRSASTESWADAVRRAREGAETLDPFELLIARPPFAGPDLETLASLVQGDPLLRSTALVLLAPSGEPGDAARFEEAGWTGYLVRPELALLKEALEVSLAHVRRGTVHGIVTRHLLSDAVGRSTAASTPAVSATSSSGPEATSRVPAATPPA